MNQFKRRPGFALAAFLSVLTVALILPSSAMAAKVSLPSSPRDLKVIVVGSEVLVRFLPPLLLGGTKISKYDIDIRPTGSHYFCDTTSCEVSGLTVHDKYSFAVAAMNKAGQGPFSEFSKFVQIKVAIYAPTPTTPPTVPTATTTIPPTTTTIPPTTTTKPPSTSYFVAQVEGGTVNERSGPGTSYSVVGTLANGATIDIACQTTGSQVQSTTVWDQLTNSAYVSDYYTNTPVQNNFSPQIARCSTPTPPASPPASGATHVGTTTNETPWRNETGVTVLCAPTPGYACTDGGYSAWLANPSGWAWRDYGGTWPSHNSYGPHNCTLYAAYRLQQNGVDDPTWNDYADRWAIDAAAAHTVVNQVPSVGSIAQWNSPSTGGHVAYVEQVTSTYIVVTADNYEDTSASYMPGGWTDSYQVQLNSPAMPDNFIHF